MRAPRHRREGRCIPLHSLEIRTRLAFGTWYITLDMWDRLCAALGRTLCEAEFIEFIDTVFDVQNMLNPARAGA